MKTFYQVETRRDRCYLLGRRMARMKPHEAAQAWRHLSRLVEDLGDDDIPKFNNLLAAIYAAAMQAKGIQLAEEPLCDKT